MKTAAARGRGGGAGARLLEDQSWTLVEPTGDTGAVCRDRRVGAVRSPRVSDHGRGSSRWRGSPL